MVECALGRTELLLLQFLAAAGETERGDEKREKDKKEELKLASPSRGIEIGL